MDLLDFATATVLAAGSETMVPGVPGGVPWLRDDGPGRSPKKSQSRRGRGQDILQMLMLGSKHWNYRIYRYRTCKYDEIYGEMRLFG